MARLSHNNVTLLDVGGANLIGNFEAAGFKPDILDQPGDGIGQVYKMAIDVKKRLTWDLTELLTNPSSNLRVSNLDISVYSLGGTSFLGDIRSGHLGVTTETFEGSGDADLWEYPVANKTDLEGSGTLLMNGGAHPILTTLMANTRQAAPVVGIFTIGPASVTVPLTLSGGSHEVSNSQGQTLAVNYKLRGNASLAITDTTTSGVLASILTGTAQFTWHATTGGGTYSGLCLVTSSRLEWQDAQIVKAVHQFHNQGQPTYG